MHHTRRSAHELNATPRPTPISGGRFDSLDGSYAYTYVADSPSAAIAETLCRDLPTDPATARLVPRVKLAGITLSRVRRMRDLSVLALHGAGLTQVRAPLSLTKCGPEQYLTTRAWAAAFRRWLPTIDGLRYRPRHDEDSFAFVLFADPTASPFLAASGSGEPLDLEPGATLVRTTLQRFNAALAWG